MAVCHLVTFTFKSNTPRDAVERLAAALDGLAAESDVIIYRHGPDLQIRNGNADYAVTAVFEDEQAFTAYITSAEHMRIVEHLLSPHLESRSAVQFRTDGISTAAS